MKEPHNYAKVGYSMIVVAASLTAIALIALAIGEMYFLQTIWQEMTQHTSMNVKKMIF